MQIAELTQTRKFGYDNIDRLTSMTNGANSIFYAYDALGRRIKRTEGANITKFTYDGMDVVMDDDNGVLTKYQNGLGIDNKLKMVTSGNAKYFLQDHLGSTVGLADSSGNVVSSASYDSFGNSTNNLTTRYQFTGREFDNFTGLQYSRARWYDANLGRFISEDPIGFAGGDVNLYGYVWNSPNKFSDPTGLDGWGNDTADYLDERIEFARQWYKPDVQEWWTDGVNNSIASLAFGVSDLFRVGSGTGDAIYTDDNGYGRVANVAMDIARASAIFSTLAGPFAGRVGGKPSVEACPVDKWSRSPKSLQDQMTLESAQTGSGTKIIDNLNDPKFKGMEKWEYKVKSADGRDSVVHYVKDPKTGKLMDFKFKKSSTDGLSNWEKAR